MQSLSSKVVAVRLNGISQDELLAWRLVFMSVGDVVILELRLFIVALLWHDEQATLEWVSFRAKEAEMLPWQAVLLQA